MSGIQSTTLNEGQRAQLAFTQYRDYKPSPKAQKVINDDIKRSLDAKEEELTNTKKRCEVEIERLNTEKSSIEKAKELSEKEKLERISSLNTQLAEKITKIRELENVLKDMPEIKRLQTTISALENEKIKRDANLKKGKLDIEGARNRIKQLEEQLTYYNKDDKRTIQIQEKQLNELKKYYERDTIRIKTLENEKKDINEELLKSQILFEQLIKKCNQTSIDYDKLNQENLTLQRSFNKALSDNDEEKKFITEKFTTRLREITQEKEVLNKRFERLDENSKNTIKFLTTANNTLKGETERLKTEKASHEAILKKIETEKNGLESQISDLNQRLKNAEKLYRDEKGRSAEVVEGLRKGVDKLTSDKNKLELKLKATEDAKNLALNTIAKLNELIKSNEFANTKLNNELTKVREELRESKERYTTVSNQLSELQRKYTTLDSQNKLTSSELKVYKRKEGNLYVELNQQLDSLKQSNSRLSTLQADLESRLKTCNSSNEALKGNLDAERKANLRSLARIDELQGKLEKCNQLYEENQEKIKTLQQQKATVESRILASTGREMDILGSESSLKEQIKQLKSQITGLNREQKELSKLKSSLESQLNTCNSSNETLKTEKEKLNNELETCRKQRKTVENHLNERIKNLNTELGNLRSEKQYLEQSRTEFKLKTKDRIGYDQEQFNEKLRNLNETISLKDEEISNVKEKLENLRQEHIKKEQKLILEIEGKNSEIGQLEGRLQASEFSLNTERGENLRLLDRINELNLAKEKAEKVSKELSDDKIELQNGITSRHSEIESLKMELQTVKDKLKGLESSPNVDFDAYNQGMTQGREEAKQNYINRINELQSIISQFEIDKERMEFQFKECSSVNEELRKKIQDLETLVKNLSLENNRFKDKLSSESNKLTKEREMYDSQYKENQKLLSKNQMQLDSYNRLDILWQKALSKKIELEKENQMQREACNKLYIFMGKFRSKKIELEEENKRNLEEITTLKERLKVSENALQESKRRLVQPVINEVDHKLQERNMYLQKQNDSLYTEIRRMQQELKLKEENIRQTSSQKAKLMEADEARLLSILRELESGIVLGTNRLMEINNTIDRQERIIQDRQRQIASMTSSVGKSSVLNGFSLSSSTMGLSNEVTSDQYDKIQRIIRNVEKVTKKSDKLFELSKGK